jgi:hypothetical protein
MPSRLTFLGAVVVTLLGCGTLPPTERPSPLLLPLRTIPVPRVCLGVGGGGGATLVGDPNDSQVAWLEGFGNRVEVVWPPGYFARFAPDLEVLDPSGKVMYREGDLIPGGCAVGPPDDPPSLILIIPQPP